MCTSQKADMQGEFWVWISESACPCTLSMSLNVYISSCHLLFMGWATLDSSIPWNSHLVEHLQHPDLFEKKNRWKYILRESSIPFFNMLFTCIASKSHSNEPL